MSGQPIREQRPDAADVLTQGAFTGAQADRALERLSTPEFQTDWGIRSLSETHADYDPNAYASGAVWGLGSSGVSTVFWNEHRPLTGWSIWHGLVAWEALDSPGHLHEVTAGDLFHPEVESVPEQTWSSAGFLTAAVHGLLGLEVHAATRTVSFEPHLPAVWGEVGIERLRVGATRVNLHLSEDERAIALEVDNPGPPATIDFDPQIPLGASLLGADVNGVPVTATVTRYAQDQHASVRLIAASGVTRAVVHYSGGVRIAPVEIAPLVGDKSVNLKLASASWTGHDTLILKAFVQDSAHAAIDLVTPMKITTVEGANVTQVAAGRYRLAVDVPDQAKSGAPSYVPVNVTVKLLPGEPLP